MENIKNLTVVFSGNTANLSAAFSRISGESSALATQLKGLGAESGGLGSKMSSAFLAVSAMAVGMSAVVAGVSMKMAYNFNDQMELLRTSAGIPQAAIAGLSKQVLDMAGTVGQAPEALAQGLYHIASAGNGIWNNAQMMDILKLAAEGANLGMGNLNDTTYALSSAMASGIEGAQNAQQAMASMTAIVGAGDMKLQDLNGALGTGLLSAGKIAGISLDSIGAALATLTDNGEPAQQAATRLTMGLTLMANPSTKAAKVLEAIGLQGPAVVASTDAMTAALAKAHVTTSKLAYDLHQPNGIMVAMVDLKTHLEAAGLSSEDAAAVMSNAFGGGRTDKALMTLFTNIDRISSKYDAITNDAGQFNQKLKDLNQTPMQKMRDAFSSIQADLVTLGSVLLPPAAKILGVIATAVNDLKTIIPEAYNRIKAFAEILLNGLRPVGKEIQKLWDKFKDSTAVTIFVQFFQQVLLPAIKTIWNSIKNNLWPSIEELGRAFGRLYQALEPGLTTALKIIAGILGGLLLGAIWLITSIINIFTKALGYAVSAISNVINWISNLISWFGNLVGIVWNTIRTVITIFSNLTPAIKDVIGLVVEIFLGLGRMILNAIGNFGRLLYDAGRSLIRGMVNGIKDSVGDVTSAIKDVASSAINAAKKALGIKSPSTVFAEIGVNVGQGLINGIDGMNGKVRSAMTDLTGGLHAAVNVAGNVSGGNNLATSGRLSPVGEQGPEVVNLPRGAAVTPNHQRGGAASGGNVTINVNVGNYGGSEGELRTFARKIYQTLQQEARSNGMSLPQIGILPLG